MFDLAVTVAVLIVFPLPNQLGLHLRKRVRVTQSPSNVVGHIIPLLISELSSFKYTCATLICRALIDWISSSEFGVLSKRDFFFINFMLNFKVKFLAKKDDRGCACMKNEFGFCDVKV